jgi:ribosomal protein L32E
MDHLIKQQQLDLMIQRVEELYQKNKKILFHLKNAKQFLKNNQADLAVITLENILLDQNVDSTMKQAHQKIISEAKMLGIKFLNQEMEFRGKEISIN